MAETERQAEIEYFREPFYALDQQRRDVSLAVILVSSGLTALSNVGIRISTTLPSSS